MMTNSVFLVWGSIAALTCTVRTAGAYSCGWSIPSSVTSGWGLQRAPSFAQGRSISDRWKIFVHSGPLFSSNNEVENEVEGEGEGNGVPDISATQADIDFMSVHDVDWAAMDPLNEILFDDYEELYIRGIARGDDTLATKDCDASYDSVMTGWDESVPTLNHISLVGRVGNDPEGRYFDSPLGNGGGNGGMNNNKPNVVVSMSLALPRYYSAWEREQEGIAYGQEETEWYNLEVWGFLAEWALKNVQKGSRIGVVGSIDTDYYRNKNTDLLSTNPKVLVQDLDILESKMEADARRGGGANSYGNNNYNNNYGGGGGGGSGNSYNSNPNANYNNNNNYRSGQRPDENRGPSFFTDDDDDDDDFNDPNRGGSAGGFFDTM
mmetsp:Transcript_18055/g.50179  ORF Transcript_18055/g.50179 Transcript_18055/m.50179 type:complete len:378 (-) Transcript_18055:2958-4091(-)